MAFDSRLVRKETENRLEGKHRLKATKKLHSDEI